jgi:hypothetical protein
MSTPPTITPPNILEVPLVDPKTGRITKEWAPVIRALFLKLNGL